MKYHLPNYSPFSEGGIIRIFILKNKKDFIVVNIGFVGEVAPLMIIALNFIHF